MTLFKLSLRNLQRSVKDYAIYFFTLVLGVSIFYVFNALDSQAVLLNVSQSTYDIIELMNQTLSAISVFVSLILGFLIVYASRFLMRRRHQEFATYMLLGMSKRSMSNLLFFETLWIGLLSLGMGLLIGVGLSQGMSYLVADMFEATMSQFRFIFSQSACVKTLIYFGCMYVFVMIFNSLSISKTTLIELLQSHRKSEEVKLKNPWLCTLLFVLSVSVLGYAYYMVTIDVKSLTEPSMILKPIVMGIVSTFGIYYALSGLLLRFLRHCRLYYRDLNSFVLRQMSSKINTMVVSISVICLMLFVTICVLSSALSIKNSMVANMNELAPADLQIRKRVNMDSSMTEYGYSLEQIEDSHRSIEETYQDLGLPIQDHLKEYVEVDMYRSESLTLADTLGKSLPSIQQKYPMLTYHAIEDIMGISDYNRLAILYGQPTYTLEGDEYMIIADYASMITLRDQALAQKETIQVYSHTLLPKYEQCQPGFVEISSNHINDGIILVPDEVLNGQQPYYQFLVGQYRNDSKDEKTHLEDQLQKISQPYQRTIDISSRLSILEASVGLGAMVTFIGLYLGIVFLISSAAILALKELSESSDNRERYQMLRKIGASEKMIHRALFKQIAIFFMCPLILAIIHSIAGMKFSMYILETFGTRELVPSILMTSGWILLIYGGYMLVTYACSKQMIKQN